jgi:non-haem Fe2+, alpha-ketoglutarate-dependent halogenase
MPAQAGTGWLERYHRDGYYAPLRVLSPEEARACRDRLEALEAEHGRPLPDDLRHRAHVFLVWLDELVRHPRILDAVGLILGENLLVWSSTFFIKEAGDGTHVPWHQDSRAYGTRAPDVVTAWLALSDSTRQSGALQVIPGSHRHGEREHVVQRVPDSLLTRRREVALDVDEADATIVSLGAGEMSLHHPGLLHGSPPNEAADRRIGIAIRYVRPTAGGVGSRRDSAMLVRGVDEDGIFDPLPRPDRDGAPEALARHAHLMRPPGPRPAVRIGADAWRRSVGLLGTLLTRAGRGLLLCGPSGCGKSVLAAGLVSRGWTPVDPRKGRGEGIEAHHAIAPDVTGRVTLDAILLLGRSRTSRDGQRLSAESPATALIGLLPYRETPGPPDMAAGIEELRPLVDRVPVYGGSSGSETMVDAVETLLAGSAAASRRAAGDVRVWAEMHASGDAPTPSMA